MGQKHANGHSTRHRISTYDTALLPFGGRLGMILEYGTLDLKDGCFYPSDDGSIAKLLLDFDTHREHLVYCPGAALGRTGVVIQYR